MQAEDFGDLMWSQMLDEVSIASTACDTNHGPLPDCSFIASNQPVPRPAPLTTATKKGKATAKRTPAARNSKEQNSKEDQDIWEQTVT
ncbi:hypothetical protein PVAP13_7NG067089 [Panicum virgatum]|uniref:Uncharacterized protein n=1 Tax=Panicum virgatum TaxID=38727 RepID=A0A8T0PX63_PANVG|nr:hypothetical protein PVAP13_7NG067089 [Panicum virgatum]